MADQEFHVVLHDIELEEEQAKRISSAIHKAIGHELATIDMGGGPLAHIPNPRWWGIWVERLTPKGLEQLGVPKGFSERFEQR